MAGLARVITGLSLLASVGLALPSGCADGGGSLCADAASHVLACSGSAAAKGITKCATTAASAVLKEDCEDILASLDGGKRDGAWEGVEGYLCQVLEIPEYCPAD